MVPNKDPVPPSSLRFSLPAQKKGKKKEKRVVGAFAVPATRLPLLSRFVGVGELRKAVAVVEEVEEQDHSKGPFGENAHRYVHELSHVANRSEQWGRGSSWRLRTSSRTRVAHVPDSSILQ